MLLYPPAQAGEPMRNSLRWQALRDGLADYEYLALYAQKYGPEAAHELCAWMVTGSRVGETNLSPAERCCACAKSWHEALKSSDYGTAVTLRSVSTNMQYGRAARPPGLLDRG